MPLDNTVLAFILVSAAGFSTAIGAALVFFNNCVQLANVRFLSLALAASAGVMLQVSYAELLPTSVLSFEEAGMAESSAFLAATGCFFGGILLMALLQWAVHSLAGSSDETDLCDAIDELDDDAPAQLTQALARESLAPARAAAAASAPGAADKEAIPIRPSDVDVESGSDGTPAVVTNDATPATGAALRRASTTSTAAGGDPPAPSKEYRQLRNVGLMTGLALGLHNLPEGLVTFFGTLHDPAVGLALAVAITIHNIPEGVAVSIPVYYATGSRWKAFLWALLSGVAEPVGALLGWLVLQSVVGPTAYGISFGVVAGMMIYIVVAELVPTALHHQPPHSKAAVWSIFAGMAVMALSLALFAI